MSNDSVVSNKFSADDIPLFLRTIISMVLDASESGGVTSKQLLDKSMDLSALQFVKKEDWILHIILKLKYRSCYKSVLNRCESRVDAFEDCCLLVIDIVNSEVPTKPVHQMCLYLNQVRRCSEIKCPRGIIGTHSLFNGNIIVSPIHRFNEMLMNFLTWYCKMVGLIFHKEWLSTESVSSMLKHDPRFHIVYLYFLRFNEHLKGCAVRVLGKKIFCWPVSGTLEIIFSQEKEM